MKTHSHLIIKVLLGGLMLAFLAFLFHPGVGQLSLVINGEPVSDSLTRFAAFPTFCLVFIIFAALSTLLFFGMGLMLFLVGLMVAGLVVFLIAPYFWPVLLIIFLTIALMSIGDRKKSE